MQRKQVVGGYNGGSYHASPGRGYGIPSEAPTMQIGAAGQGGFVDPAAAAYGARLQAWINMQVDARLDMLIPSILDRELLVMQQSIEGELDLMKSAQSKLYSLVECVSEEIEKLKVQNEAHAAVEKVMITVEELKNSVALQDRDQPWLPHLSRQEEALAEVRGLHDSLRGTHEAGLSELQASIDDMRKAHDALHGRHDALHGRHESGLVDLMSRFDLLHSRHDSHGSGLTDLQSRMMELDGKHLGLQGVHSTLEDVKRLQNSLQERHHGDYAELYRLHGETHDRGKKHTDELTQATDAMMAMKAEVAGLVNMVQTHEQSLSSWRAEITAEVAEEIRAIDNIQRSEAQKNREFRDGHLQAARASDVDDCRREFRDGFNQVEGRLLQDLERQQNRLLTDLRAEITAHLRSEAGAVAALDEQLWLTDQRLGQRIDELARMQRESVTVVERRIGNVLADRVHSRGVSPARTAFEEGRDIISRRSVTPAALETEIKEDTPVELTGSVPTIHVDKTIHVDNTGHATVTEDVRVEEHPSLETTNGGSVHISRPYKPFRLGDRPRAATENIHDVETRKRHFGISRISDEEADLRKEGPRELAADSTFSFGRSLLSRSFGR
jgi:hypothetical protein